MLRGAIRKSERGYITLSVGTKRQSKDGEPKK